MTIETTLELEHNYTSFYERLKFYLLIFIGVISILGICFLFFEEESSIMFSGAICLGFALTLAVKIYRKRHYIYAFHCDSQNVKVSYLDISQERSLKARLDNVRVYFRETSSRAGFNCEMILIVNDSKFVISNDFDWSFREMKQLFEYIKFHKNEQFTDREKAIIEKMKNRPFV